jgi:hypothetical protein
MTDWKKVESETKAGIGRLQKGLDDLLAFTGANRSAAENSTRWIQFDSLLQTLERAVEELRKIQEARKE